jgi:excinuclease UvrABC nuclease subunit
MPFESGTTLGFTEKDIAKVAPETSGVYAIFNKTRCIYVGDAQDVEASLYSHLRGGSEESYWIRSQQPTFFRLERCDEAAREAREKELIAELDPVCNRS